MNNDDIENTYTLPPVNQNKSFGAFPIINSKNENQTNINTVATSHNNVIIQRSMGKSTYNTFRKPNPQKKVISASKSQENIFSSNNNFKSRSNRRSPDIVKKSTVNQLEEYIEQIKVYIPNTGLESDSNPYASDQTLKGKTIQMNNISIYNNYNNKAKQYQHQHNTIHKPNYASKNPYYYNANNFKEASNNYYYNMMVNEDKNNHYSSLSKVLTNQPKSLPNNKNNILMSNNKQYYMRDSD